MVVTRWVYFGGFKRLTAETGTFVDERGLFDSDRWEIDFSLTLRKVQLVVYFGRVSGCWWDVIRLVIWRMHSKFTMGQRQIRSWWMLKTEWIII